MKDRNKKLILIISITLLSLLFVIGGTVAFFGWRAEEEATIDVTIASGNGECTIKEDNNIFLEPSLTKNGGRIITLKAKQEVGTKAKITWNMIINKINGLSDATFKYEMINTLTGVSYGSGTFENKTAGNTITFSNDNEVLGYGVEYEFTLYLWIDGTIGNNPPELAGQTLDFDINCNLTGTDTGTLIGTNMLMIVANTDADAATDVFLRRNSEGKGLLRNQVGSVTFVDNISIPEGNTSIDVSVNQDESVIMWYGVANESGYYDVYIGANNGKVIIRDASYLFARMTNVKTISFANAVDTYMMTSMQQMFRNCSKLTNIDFSGVDTSNVTSMYIMFSSCTNLTSLNIENWNTSNLIDMTGIFDKCSTLTSLDLSGWDTSNVTTMYGVFQYCTKLATLDLSGWDTSNVTNMHHMFMVCISLNELNLSNFDVSKVENMSLMFGSDENYGDMKLTSIDGVSNWDTSKVTIMKAMFQRCANLVSLDISNWNTENVQDMSNMFSSCRSLTSLGVSNWDTSKVTIMKGMFQRCANLVSLDISNWNTENVQDMSNMFANCTQLTTIYASEKWSIASVSNSANMFISCNNLVGGSGTVYDPNNIDATYARVDDPTNGKAGYFTYKAASV